MALNFGILQPVNIGGQMMAGEQEAQRNALAQQQFKTGELQQQHTQMQIDQAIKERDALAKMQQAFVANGKSPDMKANFNEMVQSGIPHFVDIGIKGLQSLERQSQVAKILGGDQTAPAATTPAAPAAPGALGSGTFDVNAPAAPTNALAAPTPYKPVMPRTNALAMPPAAPAAPAAPVANDLESTYRKIDQLHAIGEHELAKSFEQRVKDKLPPTMVQEFKFAQTPEGGGFKGTFEQFKTLQAPKTTVNVPVNVSTEKKYGERFGGLIAETDAAKLAAAEKAPEVAANADRIMDLISSGKVITGTGANVRLQIAKTLNLAGGTDAEKIANTEELIAAQAKATLGAIKSSNLGAGQGFTDSDRVFLEKATAGNISYDAQSLTRLARLMRLGAESSATAWNTRVKQIPKSALEGTGVSNAPITVPPRQQKPAAGASTAPAGVDQALWNVMTPEERKLWQKK